MKGISIDEWLTELNECSRAVGAEGATMVELAESAGMGVAWMRLRVRAAIKAGEWEYVRVARTSINKKIRLVDGYRPVVKSKGKK